MRRAKTDDSPIFAWFKTLEAAREIAACATLTDQEDGWSTIQSI